MHDHDLLGPDFLNGELDGTQDGELAGSELDGGEGTRESELDGEQADEPEFEFGHASPDEEFEAAGAWQPAGEESELHDVEELELSSELLEVASDEELEQFLGRFGRRLAKRFRGLARSGSLRSLLNAVRSAAKRSLPALGATLGGAAFPGAGGPLGSLVGRSLGAGLELEGLSGEDREFELARRVVRIGLDAARRITAGGPGGAMTTLRRGRRSPSSGRWVRRGSTIVLLGFFA